MLVCDLRRRANAGAVANRALHRLFLRYSARDEVALQGKGSGGVTEAQEGVKNYGEDSPLYGFIHYRRRKVILKYIPEGTSRLLQGIPMFCIVDRRC